MTQNTQGPIRVLLIEDQEIDAKLVIRMLTHAVCHSFKVEHASSLGDAVGMLADNDFDVCMLDLGLPDGMGIDSLHQIRAVDARLPVVVLTGNIDEQLGIIAIETGAQDFIAKDAVSGQLLTRALRFAIGRQQKMLGYAADANTDVLTGIPNRRRLDTFFSEMVAECGQLCLALVDIDHFKSVNDTHGHLVGDHILKQVAALICTVTESGIQAARYGGEEFALLLPETSLDNAIKVMDGLLELIRESSLEFNDSHLHVTASAGISDVGPEDSFEDSLRRSDLALYEAKRAGRNRVCVKNRCMP